MTSLTRTFARIKRKSLGPALRHSERLSLNLRRRWIRATLAARGAEHVHQIASWTSELELQTLYKLARSCRHGAVALEIGSYLGASSCYLAAGLQQHSGRLFCVDTWANQTMPEGQRDTLAEFLRNTQPFTGTIVAVQKKSNLLMSEDIATPLDLVFIDGDHSYPAVASDFERTARWLRDDGTIALHDVGISDHPGVDQVLGEAIRSGSWVLKGMVDSLAWVRRRGF
jgi:predicted O-methyltransferase YrrM